MAALHPKSGTKLLEHRSESVLKILWVNLVWKWELTALAGARNHVAKPGIPCTCPTFVSLSYHSCHLSLEPYMNRDDCGIRVMWTNEDETAKLNFTCECNSSWILPSKGVFVSLVNWAMKCLHSLMQCYVLKESWSLFVACSKGVLLSNSATLWWPGRQHQPEYTRSRKAFRTRLSIPVEWHKQVCTIAAEDKQEDYSLSGLFISPSFSHNGEFLPFFPQKCYIKKHLMFMGL